MKKLALITAIITASAVAVPAMADNNHARYKNNASNHKYVKYNNGNANGKYKHKHKKAKKYVASPYSTKHVNYRTSHMKKWPVPTTPNTNPIRHRVVIGQHH